MTASTHPPSSRCATPIGWRPENDAIRSSLVTSLMAALRSDFAANRQLAGELETLLDQPTQQAEFFRLMAVGLRQTGAINESLNYFLKLAATDGAAPNWTPTRIGWRWVRVDSELKVRRDRWIGVNLQELLAQADEAGRQRIDALVQERFQ